MNISDYVSVCVNALVSLLQSNICFPFVGLFLVIWVIRVVLYIINGGMSDFTIERR